MSIPPTENEYPIMQCPECKRQYNLLQLDTDEKEPPTYTCPNCDSVVFDPQEMEE